MFEKFYFLLTRRRFRRNLECGFRETYRSQNSLRYAGGLAGIHFMHDAPYLMKAVFVFGAIRAQVVFNGSFEIVVIGLFGKSGSDGYPCRFIDEEPAGVVSIFRDDDLACTKLVRKSLLQVFKMFYGPRTDHHPSRIDRPAVFTVALPGTHDAEKTVFGEYPHSG